MLGRGGAPTGLERSLGFNHMVLAETLVEMAWVLQHGSPVDRDRGLGYTARAASVLQTRVFLTWARGFRGGGRGGEEGSFAALHTP